MGYLPQKVEDFNRRTLSKNSSEEDRLVELITFIDGKQFTLQRSSKAEAMFFVSRPTEDGFSIEIVERGVAPYTEFTSPGDDVSQLYPWQRDALVHETCDVFRRSYPIEGDDLNKAQKIDVCVRINGSTWMNMRAREPGIMGFVTHRRGFDIHVVGPVKVKYPGDLRGPDIETYPLYPWQIDVLGLNQ